MRLPTTVDAIDRLRSMRLVTCGQCDWSTNGPIGVLDGIAARLYFWRCGEVSSLTPRAGCSRRWTCGERRSFFYAPTARRLPKGAVSNTGTDTSQAGTRSIEIQPFTPGVHSDGSYQRYRQMVLAGEGLRLSPARGRRGRVRPLQRH